MKICDDVRNLHSFWGLQYPREVHGQVKEKLKGTVTKPLIETRLVNIEEAHMSDDSR